MARNPEYSVSAAFRAVAEGWSFSFWHQEEVLRRQRRRRIKTIRSAVMAKKLRTRTVRDNSEKF